MKKYRLYSPKKEYMERFNIVLNLAKYEDILKEECYDQTYESKYSKDLVEANNVDELLDIIWSKFQRFDDLMKTPDDYYGRSLSSGDVIALIDDFGNPTAYITKSFGFEKLDNFFG